jgi:hypothetical protein
MNSRIRILLTALATVAIFAAGAAYGSRHAAAAQTAPANRFGPPKTILSISLIKFRPAVSDADKKAAIDGVRTLAGQIPGIKNIWLKTSRMQPRDFDAAFVIEFATRDAADNYAESPLHDAWSKKLQIIRETSLSPQVTN